MVSCCSPPPLFPPRPASARELIGCHYVQTREQDLLRRAKIVMHVVTIIDGLPEGTYALAAHRQHVERDIIGLLPLAVRAAYQLLHLQAIRGTGCVVVRPPPRLQVLAAVV